MRRRLFNISAALSAVLFLATLVGCFVAGDVDPSRQFATIAPGFHLSVIERGGLPRLEIFNDPIYGPYAGSVVAISSPDGKSPSPHIREIGFGDRGGIYYRHIRWADGRTLWTLSLSLFYPLAASAAIPAVWVLRRYRQRSSTRGFSVGPSRDSPREGRVS